MKISLTLHYLLVRPLLKLLKVEVMILRSYKLFTGDVVVWKLCVLGLLMATIINLVWPGGLLFQ